MDDKNNINEPNDHLDELTPHLLRLKREASFNVPADYFDDLASRIQEKCAADDELKEIAPVLSEIPKYNPFAVPVGYFDELPLQIQEKSVASPKTSWLEQLVLLLRPKLVIPAIAAVLLLAATFVLLNDEAPHTKDPQPAIAEVHFDSSITETITAEALRDIDDPTVLESLWNDPETGITEEHYYVSANEEEIIDYLVNNNADVSALVKEL